MALYGKDVWLIGPEEKAKHDKLFQSLKPINGKLSGEQSKRYFMKSNLPTPVLGQIWTLADIDKDGRMTAQEFMIGVRLIEAKLKGIEIPKILPPSLKRSSDPSYHGFSENNTHMPQPIQPSFLMNGGPAQQSTNNMYGMNPNMGVQPPNMGMQPPNMGMHAPNMGVQPNMGLQAPLNPNVGMQSTQMNFSVFPSQTSSVNRVSTLPNNFAMPGPPGGQKQTPPLSRNPSFQQMDNTLLVVNNPPTYNYSQTLPINQSAFDSLALENFTDINNLNKGKGVPAVTKYGEITGPTRLKYTQLFKAADADKSGLLTGEQARNILLQTGVNPQMLLQIWESSDINKDGNLELEEFIIAMHLIDCVKSGLALTTSLPPTLIPAHLRSPAADAIASVSEAGGGVADVMASGGTNASLSRSRSFAEVTPAASFEDRRRMNWDKGQQELERRRRELLERQRLEKEAQEQKEREIEEHKRMLREEAERKRLQELENERLRKEEQEREQERLRKEMIEQRLQAQLEAEKLRQHEWENRRKEELMNQKGLEENIVSELKNRLIKLKGDLVSETTNRDTLSTSYKEKKVEGRELHNQLEQLSKSRELRLQEICRLEGVLQKSKQDLSNIIEEREKYALQLNQSDSTTTSEALGAIKASIQQMRVGVTVLRRNLTNIEAETRIVLQESNKMSKQQKELNTILHDQLGDSRRLKDEIETKKREEYERLRLHEQNRRKQEIQEKKQEHLRKTFECELKKRQEREEEAMQKEKQIQGTSLRQRQEAHYPNAIQKPTFAKATDNSFPHYLSLKIQQTNLLKKQDAIVQKQQDALENTKIPPARPRTRPQHSPVKHAPPQTTTTSRKDNISNFEDISNFESAFPDPAHFDNTSFVADFSALESVENMSSAPPVSTALTISESPTPLSSLSSGKSKKPPPRPRPPQPINVELSNSITLNDPRRNEKVEETDPQILLEREKEQIEKLKKGELEKEMALVEQEKRVKEAQNNEEREKEEKIKKDADVKRKVEEMQRKRLEKKQASSPKVSPDRPPTGPGEQTKKKMFKMVFDFEARNPDELSLHEGNLVQVDESDTSAPAGWLTGTYNGATGLFPANYGQNVQENFSDYVDLDMQAAGSLPVTSQELPSTTTAPKTLSLCKQPIETKAEEMPKLKPVPRSNSRKPLGSSGPKVAVLPPETPLKLLQPLGETGKIKQQKTTDSKKEAVQFPSYDLVPTSNAEHVNTEASSESKVEDIYQNSTELHSSVDISSRESFQAQALYPYRAQKEDHLSFDKNDYINVQQQQDQWWFGECNGKSGWFPKSYVKAVAASTTISPTLAEAYDARETGETSSSLVQSSELPATLIEECVALFEYTGPEGDLSFMTGDMISVTAKNGDWWEGTLKGNSGTFPANYVKLKEVEAEKKPEVAMVSTVHNAVGKNEISLKAGQLIHVMQKEGDWWQGEVQVRGKNKPLGWFPASHVKLMSTKQMKEKKVSVVGTLEHSPVQEDIYSAPVKRKDQLDHVLAMFSYTAQNDDELTFCKGSVINVISKDGDWWRGEVNGHVGVFPYNYVQVLRSDTPQQTSQWSGAFDSSVLKSMSATERKRQNHIYELINTEQDYMTDLSLTLEVFYNPLAESEMLTQHELNVVFVNWKELIMCNMKFLKAMLVRRKMSTTDKIEGIGDVLIEQLPRFSPYIRFCGCMLKACQLLQAKVEKEPEFKQFEKKCAGDKRLKQNLPLSSYLLKPLQRITKYPLLITGILNYTPEDHFDRENLIIALERAEDLCTQINEAVRSQESSNRLEWLQERVNLDGLDEKLIFNSQTNCLGQRKYLFHGTLYKHKSNKELKSFMFNDFLLLCRVQSANTTRSSTSMFHPDDDTKFTIYKKPIFLNEVIVKCASDPDVNDTLFHVTHIDRVYSFRAETKVLRNSWVCKIQAASQLFIETEREKRSKASRARSLGDNELGRLVVTIIEGADLQASDPTGFSDPYCEVSMGSQEHRTKVIQKDLNPKWNSTMVFNIKDAKKDVLCISVFDRDFFSPNDFLGRTEVTISQILEKGKGPITKRLLLHEVSTGEIVVTLEIQNMHM